MKTLFLPFILLLLSLPGVAQNDKTAKNNQWLEKTLNELTGYKAGEGALPHFRFDACTARVQMGLGKQTLNVGFNYTTNLASIEQVDYQQVAAGYKFRLQSGDQQSDDGSFNFTVETSDENLVKEIRQRLRTAVADCRDRSK